jgi:hypothetical protein
MSRYRHPHLVRGTVHTSQGAFAISRGVVEIPDHIGAMFGWLPLEQEQFAVASPASRLTSDPTPSSGEFSR